MGLKFNLELIPPGDDYNLKLYLSGKTLGKSILCFEGLKIINLKKNIANNILNILNSNQVLDNINNYQQLNNEYVLKGLFMDCHSLALSVAIGCSVIDHSTLNEEIFNSLGLERIQVLKVGDELHNLEQGDILTSDEDNEYNHSVIYLGKDIYDKDLFLSCNGKDGFIDYEGVYHKKLNKRDFNEIMQTLNGLDYVKKGYRIGGPLSMTRIEQMYIRCQYHGIQELYIYRKVKSAKNNKIFNFLNI